jgi:hypothetical protein
MARFCVATGMRPDDYLALTLRQRAAFIRALNIKHGIDDEED